MTSSRAEAFYERVDGKPKIFLDLLIDHPDRVRTVDELCAISGGVFNGSDPDGGCWLSRWGTSGIAHVTEDGDVREVALPASSEPHGLVIGPDGALWSPSRPAPSRVSTDDRH